MNPTKTEILNEIRRTAKENGGTPLGTPRFEKETGIKVHKWRGVYWARWSEAVREAGFEPNKMTEAFNISHLITKFVELALELGRLPAKSDIQLKRRHDSSFPNWIVFRGFGSKDEILKKIIHYCGDAEKFSPVIAWCNERLRGLRQPLKSSPEGDVPPGFVYMIRHGTRREYKIGRTNNTLRREGEITIELPERVHPVHVITTDDPAGIEAYWHKRFEARRKNGEWFELSASDVAAFKRWRRIF